MDLICHIAPLGMKKDWIIEGLLYYDWNYLIILTTSQEEYVQLANELKQELNPSFQVSDNRKLEKRLIKTIEIISIDDREILSLINTLKVKAREKKAQGYKIYFNATSGLELWKFSAYFIAGTDKIIDKFYYIPKDSSLTEPIKPLEIYLPLPISNPLKNILKLIDEQGHSQKGLIEYTNFSKGLISRYLKELRGLDLIKISQKKKGKERYFDITEKGRWYL